MPTPIELGIIRKPHAILRALIEDGDTSRLLNTAMSKMYLMCDPMICTTCNSLEQLYIQESNHALKFNLVLFWNLLQQQNTVIFPHNHNLKICIKIYTVPS